MRCVSLCLQQNRLSCSEPLYSMGTNKSKKGRQLFGQRWYRSGIYVVLSVPVVCGISFDLDDMLTLFIVAHNLNGAQIWSLLHTVAFSIWFYLIISWVWAVGHNGSLSPGAGRQKFLPMACRYELQKFKGKSQCCSVLHKARTESTVKHKNVEAMRTAHFLPTGNQNNKIVQLFYFI